MLQLFKDFLTDTVFYFDDPFFTPYQDAINGIILILSLLFTLIGALFLARLVIWAFDLITRLLGRDYW